MKGQWTGRYLGTNAGLAVVDIDDAGDAFEVAACLFDDAPALPGTFARMRIPKGITQFNATVPLWGINRQASWPIPAVDVSNTYPGVAMPATADVKLRIKPTRIKADWQTALGTHGVANLELKTAPPASRYRPEPRVKTWSQFKRYVDGLDVSRFIFRGQPAQWPLRTAFHRTSRSDLGKFVMSDVPLLSGRLTAVLDHIFDLSRAAETGALYSIAQHHGYPTPMLDWTRSPFIAAYFAFRPNIAGRPDSDKIRIFVFDVNQWKSDFPQWDKVAFTPPHLSTFDLFPFRNSRFVPQQSVVTVTNIDDVEGYIRQAETARNKKYLTVIDLPWRDRLQALRNLAVMGITPGALFPGLDGVCEELRNLHFGF